MSCQDVDEREGDIKLMREELEEAQERQKEAEVVLKVKALFLSGNLVHAWSSQEVWRGGGTRQIKETGDVEKEKERARDETNVVGALKMRATFLKTPCFFASLATYCREAQNTWIQTDVKESARENHVENFRGRKWARGGVELRHRQQPGA